VPEDKADLLDLQRAGSILISVTDTGVGLTPHQLGEICAEGVQFNANTLQAGQGSGLGLYISKGLDEQHSGRLTVASEGLGKGAVLQLELPLYRRHVPCATLMAMLGRPSASQSEDSSATALIQHQSSVDSAAPTVGTERSRGASYARRVLVVDDAVSNRKMLMRLLKARGFLCEQAEDGQQALDVYPALQDRGEHVDTIVMDYEMPVMDGPTATRALRQQLGCTCLIVGVTGNLLPDDVDYFKKQGANAVLGKPLNVRAFEEILDDFHAKEEIRAAALEVGAGAEKKRGADHKEHGGREEPKEELQDIEQGLLHQGARVTAHDDADGKGVELMRRVHFCGNDEKV